MGAGVAGREFLVVEKFNFLCEKIRHSSWGSQMGAGVAGREFLVVAKFDFLREKNRTHLGALEWGQVLLVGSFL